MPLMALILTLNQAAALLNRLEKPRLIVYFVHAVGQVVIPAWYSEDLSQEMQELSLQADKLVPALLGPRSNRTSQLLVSKGEHQHFSSALG